MEEEWPIGNIGYSARVSRQAGVTVLGWHWPAALRFKVLVPWCQTASLLLGGHLEPEASTVGEWAPMALLASVEGANLLIVICRGKGRRADDVLKSRVLGLERWLSITRSHLPVVVQNAHVVKLNTAATNALVD